MESTHGGVIQWSCSGFRIGLFSVIDGVVAIDVVQLDPRFKVGFVWVKEIFHPIADP